MEIMREHDLCSPSQLALREKCPASARLQRQIEGTGEKQNSAAADRGTFLHKCTECIMTKQQFPDEYDNRPNGDKMAVLWAANNTINILTGLIPSFEVQVDLNFLGISGGKEGCRIDALGIGRDGNHSFIDWKFGEGRVTPPKLNRQIQGYACGVRKKYGGNIAAYIVQPEEEEEKQVQMYRFGGEELDTAELQISEIVKLTKDDSIEPVRGWWCIGLFCKAKDICPAYRGTVLEIPRHVTVAAHIKSIEPAERAKLYENICTACSWFNSAKATIEYIAIKEKLQIDGYEVGPGKEARDWTNPDAVINVFRDIVSQNEEIKISDLVIPQSPVSPSQSEKILGKSKKIKALFNDLIMKTPGKLSLKKIKKSSEGE